MREYAQTLDDAFARIVEVGKLNVTREELLAYAEEDTLGGRDNGEFPDGVSPYAAEGKLIYALVRAMKPEIALELGCAVGGSAAHILAALAKNRKGKLVSVDVDPNSGSMIPKKLKSRWELVVGDAKEVEYPKADFVFEDCDHSQFTTHRVIEKARAMGAKVIVCHDYALYEGVRIAFNEAFGEQAIGTLLGQEFSPVGMGVWVNNE